MSATHEPKSNCRGCYYAERGSCFGGICCDGCGLWFCVDEITNNGEHNYCDECEKNAAAAGDEE